jgi:IS30 family transposase
MAEQSRRYLSNAEKTELWERWQQGERISDIARALGRRYTTISGVVKSHAGFVPRPRKRAAYCLTLAEREEISRGLVSGWSIRQISRQLSRAPSTISREVQRNGGRLKYRAISADQAAWTRALRPKPCKLALQPRLRRIVAGKLKRAWSPEQIAGWLKRRYPQNESLRVSHETIYRSLFIQSRGALKQELLKHLRSGRRIRHSRYASGKGGKIVDPISIRERPAEVEDRAVPGHWEGDLILGSSQSQSSVATLVERQTRYVMLAKLENKQTDTVVSALSEIAQVTNVGSWYRTGRPQALYGGYESTTVFLRSA